MVGITVWDLANSSQPEDIAEVHRLFMAVGNIIKHLANTCSALWANCILKEKDSALMQFTEEIHCQLRNTSIYWQNCSLLNPAQGLEECVALLRGCLYPRALIVAARPRKNWTVPNPYCPLRGNLSGVLLWSALLPGRRKDQSRRRLLLLLLPSFSFCRIRKGN